MKWAPFILLLFVAMILQGGNWLNFICVGDCNAKPDLLLILLVFYAVSATSYRAVIASFIIGFASDVLSLPMGPNMISYLLVGLLLSNSRNLLLFNNMILQFVLIFIVSILAYLFTEALTLLAQPSIAFSSCFLSKLFIGSLYSAVVGALICQGLLLIRRSLGVRHRRR